MKSNRRRFVQTAFMGLTGSFVLSTQARAKTVEQTQTFRRLLDQHENSEAYWELIKKQFKFEMA